MWNLMNKMNRQNRNRLISTEVRLVAVRRERGGRLVKKVKGLSKKKKKRNSNILVIDVKHLRGCNEPRIQDTELGRQEKAL